MGEGAKCGNCIYWRIADDDGGGECRRNAPRPHFPNPGEGDKAAFWPITDMADWCGEHQPISPPRPSAHDLPLELTVRTSQMSMRARKTIWKLISKIPEVNTVGHLAALSENDLYAIKNCGFTTVKEIREWVKNLESTTP